MRFAVLIGLFLSSCFYSEKCDQVVTQSCNNDNDTSCEMKTQCEDQAYRPSLEGI